MSNYYSATPLAMLNGFFKNRSLIWELVKRDFIGRYKGSFFGVVWSLFNPLLMLAIYTVVFSVAFKAKWGVGEESKVAFAIVLFSGIIVSNFFAECINRSPGLITSNPNYVKKVIFPIEILAWMALFSALLHFIVSLGVLILFCLLINLPIHIGAMLIPVIILPLVLIIMGFSWLFASLGVYLRDLSQLMGMVTTILLFMAPIFYPIEALPESYRAFLIWNPITLPVIQLRDLLIWNKPINWDLWLFSLVIGMLICQIGYWWFQKSRRGFADVL